MLEEKEREIDTLTKELGERTPEDHSEELVGGSSCVCVCVRDGRVSLIQVKNYLVGGMCDFFVVDDPDKKGKEITYEIKRSLMML